MKLRISPAQPTVSAGGPAATAYSDPQSDYSHFINAAMLLSVLATLAGWRFRFC